MHAIDSDLNSDLQIEDQSFLKERYTSVNEYGRSKERAPQNS